MQHVSELEIIKDAGAICERMTGKSPDEWEEVKARRLRQAVSTGTVQIGHLYTTAQAREMSRRYGLPFDAFEVVTVRLADVSPTKLEEACVVAYRDGKRTIQRGDKSYDLNAEVKIVHRLRLVRLEVSPSDHQSGRHRQLPVGDRD